MIPLPPERHRCGWSSRSSSEPPPAESQLEAKIEFLRPVSPFFSWAGGKKDLSVHCNPFPGREDIPSPTACQPSVSPRDRGAMWMLTRRAPPTLNPNKKIPPHGIFENQHLAANLKFPPNSPYLIHTLWNVTNYLPEQKQRFWLLTHLTIFFFPLKLRDSFCRKRMKHENRPFVQPFVSTECNVHCATQENNHAEV